MRRSSRLELTGSLRQTPDSKFGGTVCAKKGFACMNNSRSETRDKIILIYLVCLQRKKRL
jgi:hypothetical protein